MEPERMLQGIVQVQLRRASMFPGQRDGAYNQACNGSENPDAASRGGLSMSSMYRAAFAQEVAVSLRLRFRLTVQSSQSESDCILSPQLDNVHLTEACMFGLIPLGIFHLAVSLVAVGTGAYLLVKDGKITAGSSAGLVYIAATVVTCGTALGIYQHGGFGNAHILAILTLVVLFASFAAGKTQIFGGASRYVEVVGFSATFLFHMIPAFTEAFTRLPYGAPLASSSEDPLVKLVTGILFFIFLIGAVRQVQALRRG
jgi:uncharacterized membrane protein